VRERVLLRGRDVPAICQEVVARGLHPEQVDVDTGTRILPLVLDDRHHFALWIRLYSHILAARNLYIGGAVERALWEIGGALTTTDNPPCFLESIYLDQTRLLLRSAERALREGQTSLEAHGPYTSLLIAENWCLLRLFRRQVNTVDTDFSIASTATDRLGAKVPAQNDVDTTHPLGRA